MVCPKCGVTVLKSDVVCKKCGAVLAEAADQYKAEDICRSRAKLLFQAWVGATSGLHLKWLGYDERAKEVASEYGFREQLGTIFEGMLNPFAWLRFLKVICYQCVICIGIIFGMYRTDASGHPVRWNTKSK